MVIVGLFESDSLEESSTVGDRLRVSSKVGEGPDFVSLMGSELDPDVVTLGLPEDVRVPDNCLESVSTLLLRDPVSVLSPERDSENELVRVAVSDALLEGPSLEYVGERERVGVCVVVGVKQRPEMVIVAIAPG